MRERWLWVEGRTVVSPLVAMVPPSGMAREATREGRERSIDAGTDNRCPQKLAANATRPVLREDRQLPTDVDDASRVIPLGFLPHRNTLRPLSLSTSLVPPALGRGGCVHAAWVRHVGII